jgi:hypothetical protein
MQHVSYSQASLKAAAADVEYVLTVISLLLYWLKALDRPADGADGADEAYCEEKLEELGDCCNGVAS